MVIKKVKKFLLVLLAVLFLGIGKKVLALELNYPVIPIPGIPVIGPASGIAQYLVYFFGLAILSAGLMGVISIVIGGIQLLTSGGNPTAASIARERIVGSILGIILLMFSYILLNTINPQLVNPGTSPLAIQAGYPGIFYIDTSTNPALVRPAPTAANTQDIPANYRTLYYSCTQPGPDLWVWGYPSMQNQDDNDPGAIVTSIPCVSSSNLNQATLDISNFASFKWAVKTPGVYFYLQKDCQGAATDAITVSGSLPPDFQNTAQSIQIINGNTAADPRYGVILNKDPELKGECSMPLMNFNSGNINKSSNKGICKNLSALVTVGVGGNSVIGQGVSVIEAGANAALEGAGALANPVSSVHIIRGANPDFPANFPGDGVSIYEDGGPDPDNLGSRLIGPRYAKITYIKQQFSLDGIPTQAEDQNQVSNIETNPDDFLRHTVTLQAPTNPNATDTCMTNDFTYPCTSIIDPRGHYLAVFYGQNEKGPNKTCEVFTQVVGNLRNEDILSNNRIIYRMDIFPIQP